MAMSGGYPKWQTSLLKSHPISLLSVLSALLVLIYQVISNPRYNPSGYTSYTFSKLLPILIPLSGLKSIISLWDVKNLILTPPSSN